MGGDGGERAEAARPAGAQPPWPTLDGLADDKAEAEIGWVIDLVTAIRSMRAEMNITAAIPLVLAGARRKRKRARRTLGRVHQAPGAGVGDFVRRRRPQGSVQLVVRGEVAALPLKGVIDLAAERARLAKEMAQGRRRHRPRRRQARQCRISSRARAEEVVEEENEKREEAVARKAKIAEALERLKNAS